MDEAGRETAPSVLLEELAHAATAVIEEIPTPRLLTPGRPLLRDWAEAAACGPDGPGRKRDD